LETQICCRCNEQKELNHFYKTKRSKSGYTAYCKQCKKKYWDENKEKLNANKRKKRQGNKEKRLQEINYNSEGKICRKCGIWKPFDEFHVHKECYGGHSSTCKTCKLEYRQSRKEETSQFMKEYYQENKKRIIGYAKTYYKENLDERKEYDKKRKQRDKEKISKRQKKYYQLNRELFYRKNQERRSYKHKVIFTPYERKQILDRDNWTCQTCGIKVHDRHTGNWNTPDKAHIDHIIPISKGGNSEPKNLRILCRTCNLSKHDKQDEQLKFQI
jgi:5-methylcytosine-specific restriction endonuclease McrA